MHTTNDPFTQAKLDQIHRDLNRLRLEQTVRSPGYVPPASGTVRRAAIFSLLGLLLLLEALVVAVMAYKVLGSENGLNLRQPDGSVIVWSLHWDGFAALLTSIVAAVAWITLFFLPVIGPVVGAVISLIWGVLAFMASGSIGFGVALFLASLLLRIAARRYGRLWLSLVEWGLAIAVLIVLMAPRGSLGPLHGFGLWEELRQMHDIHSCDRQLRISTWKNQYTGTAAFSAARKSCADARARARDIR